MSRQRQNSQSGTSTILNQHISGQEKGSQTVKTPTKPIAKAKKNTTTLLELLKKQLEGQKNQREDTVHHDIALQTELDELRTTYSGNLRVLIRREEELVEISKELKEVKKKHEDLVNKLREEIQKSKSDLEKLKESNGNPTAAADKEISDALNPNGGVAKPLKKTARKSVVLIQNTPASPGHRHQSTLRSRTTAHWNEDDYVSLDDMHSLGSSHLYNEHYIFISELAHKLEDKIKMQVGSYRNLARPFTNIRVDIDSDVFRSIAPIRKAWEREIDILCDSRRPIKKALGHHLRIIYEIEIMKLPPLNDEQETSNPKVTRKAGEQPNGQPVRKRIKTKP